MQHHIGGRIQRESGDYTGNPWFCAVARLKQALGRSTSHVDTTGQALDLFDQELGQLDWQQEVMILTDEKWRDHPTAFEDLLQTRSAQHNRPIVVVTHGYQHRVIGHGVWLVSWPAFFLQSSHYQPSKFSIRPAGLKTVFSSLNRRPALHRLYLGLRLHQQGLLDQVIFSMGSEDHPTRRAVAETWPGFAEFEQLLPIEQYDCPHNDHTVDHPAYRDAYCNIVTETDTEWDLAANATTHEIITEKSYKPFLAGQLALFLSAPGHMAYLESLGFEVFWDLVPQGYDLMSTQHKVQAIVDLVARGPEWIEQFYWAHLPEIQYNWDWIQSGQVERRLIDSIQQLIK